MTSPTHRHVPPEGGIEILQTCQAEDAIHASSVEAELLWELIEWSFLRWETSVRDQWLVLTKNGKKALDRARLTKS